MWTLVVRVLLDAPVCAFWCSVFHVLHHRFHKRKDKHYDHQRTGESCV